MQESGIRNQDLRLRSQTSRLRTQFSELRTQDSGLALRQRLGIVVATLVIATAIVSPAFAIKRIFPAAYGQPAAETSLASINTNPEHERLITRADQFVREGRYDLAA